MHSDLGLRNVALDGLSVSCWKLSLLKLRVEGASWKAINIIFIVIIIIKAKIYQCFVEILMPQFRKRCSVIQDGNLYAISILILFEYSMLIFMALVKMVMSKFLSNSWVWFHLRRSWTLGILPILHSFFFCCSPMLFLDSLGTSMLWIFSFDKA